MIDRQTFSPGKILNRAQLLSGYLGRREKVLGLPVEIVIESTSACNLNCAMCPRSDAIAKRRIKVGFMEEDLFKKVVDEIKDFAEIIYLHGLGEPTLHPKFFEFLDIAKRARLRVGISTNATTLDQRMAERLLASGLDYLILAIDAVRKKTYERIRVGGDFELVRGNIDRFLRLKRERGLQKPFCVIQFVKQEANKEEVGEFLSFWRGKGAVLRVKPAIPLTKVSKKGKRWEDENDLCFHIYRQLNIMWDGTVVPCCEDCYKEYPLGNVKDTSLRELWNGRKMRALRKAIASGQRKKILLCKTCLYPQPTRLQAAGSLLVDHFTLKKALPFLEQFLGSHDS